MSDVASGFWFGALIWVPAGVAATLIVKSLIVLWLDRHIGGDPDDSGVPKVIRPAPLKRVK